MTSFQDLIPGVRLARGAHGSAGAQMCAMEMVAWLEGLPHSDKPDCTCPVLATYVRLINDRMPDGERDRLIPFLPRLVGTVSPAHERARAESLAWAAIRVFAPAALRLISLPAEAAALETAPDFATARTRAAAAAQAARRARRAPPSSAADAAAYAAADAAAADAAADAAYAAAAAAAADAAADAAYAAAAAAAYAAAAAAAYAAYAAAAAAAYAAAAAAARKKRGSGGRRVEKGGEGGDPWGAALKALDDALAIGPQAEGFSRPAPADAARRLGMVAA